MGRWARIGGVCAGALLVGVLVGALPGVAVAAPAATITASEGQSFSGVVDTVSCADAGRVINVSIDWGDQTAATSGTVAQTAPNTCTISGTHTYAEEGSYVTQVSSNVGTDIGSATVKDTQPSANSGGTFFAAAGATVSGVLATFTDPAPEPAQSYTATIDWGDGHSTPGVISSSDAVSGSHTYTYGGNYLITVTIHDEGGATATPTSDAVISGCPPAAAIAPGPKFAPPANDLNSRFVQALYHDLLGRLPSSGELAAAGAALADGATREQVAASLLKSAEYRQDLVDGTYLPLLGHSPSAQTTNTLVGLLAGGGSDEAMEAQILGSSEYFAGPGDNSTDGFLTALYCQTVFRAIDQPTQNSDETALGQGVTRSAIAASLLGTAEYRSQHVAGYYLRYLRRAGSSAEIAKYVSFIQGGGSDEQVVAKILGAQEYYELFNPTVTAVATASAQGTIHTTLSSRARVILTVLHLLPKASDAASTRVALPSTRRVGVVDFGIHRKGRLTLHWNRKVKGRRLHRGKYLLLLRAYHGRKLIYVSDALPFTVR